MDNVNVVDELGKKIDAKNAEIDGLKNVVAALDKKVSEFSIPQAGNANDVARKVADSLKVSKKGEIKNIVTENGTGAIEVVSEIVRALTDKGKIAPLVRSFYGDNAKVNIPVFDPGMARPAGLAQGSESASADSATMSPVSLTPYPFIAELAIDRLALRTTNLVGQLQDIFGDAYGQAWDYQILNGTGNYQFTGVYDATWVASVASAYSDHVKTAASATAITWKELSALTRLAKAYASNLDSLALVIHPDVMSTLVTASGASCAAEIEYSNKQSVNGVKVIESTFAPSTMTTGKYVAVCADFSRYGAAFVNSIDVEGISKIGSANVYEQSYIYANGAPMNKSAFFYLKLA